MKSFDTLVFKSHPGLFSTIQAIEFFPNGYGISVINSHWSYGGNDELYECAVLEGNSDDYYITYDTPITNDVIGYCTEEDVSNIMKQIQEL